jgi:hypothetical protein
VPETSIHETSFTSDTLIAENSDKVYCSTTDGNSIAGGEVLNVQEDLQHAPTAVDRYFKQKILAHGKVAYVVFSGHDVGVFYNWCMFILL